LTGVKTSFGFGPQIKNSVDQKPFPVFFPVSRELA
jgi:hypothetical protein